MYRLQNAQEYCCIRHYIIGGKKVKMETPPKIEIQA